MTSLRRCLIAAAGSGMLLLGTTLVRPPSAIAETSPGSLRATAELGHSSAKGAATVDLGALPKASGKLTGPQPPHPRGVSASLYAARKKQLAEQAKQAANPASPPALRPSNGGLETPGTSVRFAGQSENGATPSDMAIAVSQSYVVQVVNETIAVYSKSGVLQTGFPKSLGTFFSGSTGDVGDPRAFYDWSKNRFVVIADDFTGGRIYVAASATSDPRGSWHVYSFAPWGAANCRASGNACADFPTTGFDDSTIYIGTTLFPAAGGVDDFMLLLPKASIYAGAGFSFNFWSNFALGGTPVDSIQPAALLTGSEHPRAGFAVNSLNIEFGNGQCFSGCNGLVVWAFSNNLVASGSPGPEVSGVFINTANNYSLPAPANEPGCAGCVDTGDTRISGMPTYHTGAISASLNTNGSDGHSHTLWFQVVPTLNDNDPRCTGSFTNKCPQITAAHLINENCYFCGGQGTNGSTYYGTLASDVAGNLTMVFNYSDDNTFPESAYASRRVTQTQNTMHDNGLVLCGGSTFYGQGRWGDYTGAVGDISSATQGYMWFSAMNSISGGNWGTCIGKNGFTSGSQP